MSNSLMNLICLVLMYAYDQLLFGSSEDHCMTSSYASVESTLPGYHQLLLSRATSKPASTSMKAQKNPKLSLKTTKGDAEKEVTGRRVSDLRSRVVGTDGAQLISRCTLTTQQTDGG